MTDTRKEFKEWWDIEKKNPVPDYGQESLSSDIALHSWQACQSLNDKRIQQLLAVIEAKNEALQLAIEYQEEACQYFHDAMAGYKEHEHERYRDDLKETKQALAIKPEDVELLESGYLDEFDNFEKSLKPWMQEEPNVTWQPVYTIKTKE